MEYAYICHSGIKYQKWGTRRWQYADGTLTPEGKIRYAAMRKEREQAKRLLSSKKSKTPKLSKKEKKALKKAEEEEEERRKKNEVTYDYERRNKSMRSMSDDELRAEVARLKLEESYKDLMKKVYPTIEKNPELKKWLKEVVSEGTKPVAKDTITSVLGGIINAAAGTTVVNTPATKAKENQKKNENNSGNNKKEKTMSTDDAAAALVKSLLNQKKGK